MKESHDASVVKFDGVCVDLFFRQRRFAGKLISQGKNNRRRGLYNIQNDRAHFVALDKCREQLV